MLRPTVAAVLACFATQLFAAEKTAPGVLRAADEILIPIVDSEGAVEPFFTTHEDDSQIPPGCWISMTRLGGGKQEGVDLVMIHNGKLTITVVPARGMSILDVRRDDKVELGWKSPVAEVVHPKFINLESRGGLGWLDGFNEWMTRCGLEFAGHPGLDQFTTNTGDQASMMLSLHGKIGNIPASVAVVVVRQDRIAIRGRVSERMFYGPKLDMQTEVSIAPGEDAFRITDSVKNSGAFDQEFQLIYHANYGQPLLNAGSKLLAATKSVTPMNDHAAKSVADYATYKGPTKGFVEEVFLMEPLSDKDGKTVALLSNATGDKGTSLTWSVSELPYLTQWKNTAAEADGYVTGIEPATGYPFNRRVERHFGRVPKLAPNQTRTFTLDFGIHTGTAAVQAVEKRIKAIQGNQKIEVRTTAPVVKHIMEAK